MTAPFQVSGGPYPLIQQPSPFEELAQTIRGIQAQRQARLLQNLQRQQLMAGIQHLAAQTQLTQAQTGAIPSEIAARGAATNASNAEARFHGVEATNAEDTAKRQQHSREQYSSAIGPMNAALAGGVDPTSPQFRTIMSNVLSSVDDEDARTRILGEYHNIITDAATQTAAQSAADNAANTKRFNASHPRIAGASPGQLSYMVGEDRINAENARAGNKEPTPVERLAGNQAESAQQSLDSMKEIASRNPEAAQEALRVINSREVPWKIGSIVQAFRGTGSQDAQNFVSHYGNFQLSTAPAYGGTRPTAVLMGLSNLADIPGIGATNFDVPFANAQRRVEDLRAKAGRAARPLATSGPASGTPAAAPDGAPRNFNQFLSQP